MGFCWQSESPQGPRGLLGMEPARTAGRAGSRGSGVRIPLTHCARFPEASPRKAAHGKGRGPVFIVYCVPDPY